MMSNCPEIPGAEQPRRSLTQRANPAQNMQIRPLARQSITKKISNPSNQTVTNG